MLRLDDGLPAPLGARWDGRGVNFALFSAHASAVELCLFDQQGRRECRRAHLPCRTDQVWHGYIDGLHPGQLYGYRVHGPYDPANGHRFNPNKLVLDPYARQFQGAIRWHDALFGYRPGAQRGDVSPDRRDSAPMMPKCVVDDPSHDWGADIPPRRPWKDSVIYEAHVKGLSQCHPMVPEAMRGTYAALGHPATVAHLVKLGITAVELLPIQTFADDRFLVAQGLKNYWGYSPYGYFAPDPRYMGPYGVVGLKAAIRTLHDAGIEVILDVVYNHTAEGNHLGPTLSFRGIDNASYYKLAPEDPRLNWDSTGTGNTLDLSHPRVLQMVMDSLRHWVEVYHIDGFRFDLAPSLARDPLDVGMRAGFLQACAQDPVLGGLKLIAEPWDLGPDGYRLGGFPPGWSEWNDQFRDVARTYWRADPGQLPHLARVITGSRDLFEQAGRHPWAGVNFISAHDGFTLHDLVSFNERHNEANGEGNRDGHNHNISWNCGAEGPSDDPAIMRLRARQKRNMLATVMLSQGVPMLLMGDELSRTQHGNNNAYCQDNNISWMDWHEGEKRDPDLLAFTRSLLRIRKSYDAFRRRSFLTGGNKGENTLKDIYWLAPDGRQMTPDDWNDGLRRCIGLQFGNDAPDGRRVLLLLNADAGDVAFTLSPDLPGGRWNAVFDTRSATGSVQVPIALIPGETLLLEARSLLLLEHAATESALAPDTVAP